MENEIQIIEELKKAINQKDSTKFLYIYDASKNKEWSTEIIKQEYDNLIDIGNAEFFSF